MKQVKRIISVIATILVSLLLIYNLYNMISYKILKKDLATINGYAVMEVVSGSMEPTINIGDMIIINTHDKDLSVGDIITFKDVNNAFVTHRIMSINEDTLITKGDFNNDSDDEFSKDLVVGKYVKRIKGLGRLFTALKSPFVLVMILVIGVLICVFVSTDKDGNVLKETEKEEFKEYLKKKK